MYETNSGRIKIDANRKLPIQSPVEVIKRNGMIIDRGKYNDKPNGVNPSANPKTNRVKSSISSFSDLSIESWDNSSTSSLSWFEEYDQTACEKVAKHLELIEGVLYDEIDGSHLKKSLRDECSEWKRAFPHFRIRGRAINRASESRDFNRSTYSNHSNYSNNSNKSSSNHVASGCSSRLSSNYSSTSVRNRHSSSVWYNSSRNPVQNVDMNCLQARGMKYSTNLFDENAYPSDVNRAINHLEINGNNPLPYINGKYKMTDETAWGESINRFDTRLDTRCDTRLDTRFDTRIPNFTSNYFVLPPIDQMPRKCHVDHDLQHRSAHTRNFTAAHRVLRNDSIQE